MTIWKATLDCNSSHAIHARIITAIAAKMKTTGISYGTAATAKKNIAETAMPTHIPVNARVVRCKSVVGAKIR